MYGTRFPDIGGGEELLSIAVYSSLSRCAIAEVVSSNSSVSHPNISLFGVRGSSPFE